jgi:hypothetical protein
MKHLALTGRTFSGKSTVAKALEAEGYLIVQYSDLLKVAAVVGLRSAMNILGDRQPRYEFTLAEVKEDKEDFRILLQEFGTHLMFDHGGPWIDKALEPWYEAGKPPMVLDCVRTNSQIARLLIHQIPTVELKIRRIEQQRRAQLRGMTKGEFERNNRNPIEREQFYKDWISLSIDATLPTAQIVERIINHEG